MSLFLLFHAQRTEETGIVKNSTPVSKKVISVCHQPTELIFLYAYIHLG